MTPFSAAELDDQEIEIELLVGGKFRIPSGGFAIFHGPPNVGKSWAVLFLALTLAVEDVNSFLILGETSKRALAGRLLAVARSMGADREAFEKIVVTLDPPVLSGPREFDELYTELERFDPKLVVIDPLASVFGGDENSARDVGAFVQGVREITRQNVAVLVVHHDRKAYGGVAPDLRGSSALKAAADESYAFTNASDSVRVANDKSRDFVKLDDFSFRVHAHDGDQISLVFSDARLASAADGTARAILKRLALGPATSSELRASVKKAGGVLSRALNELRTRGAIVEETSPQAGRGGRPTRVYRIASLDPK